MTPPPAQLYIAIDGDAIQKMKICSMCGGDPQPITNFYKKHTRDGLAPHCKNCHKDSTRAKRKEEHLAREIEGTKVCACATCEYKDIPQPLSNFNKSKSGRFGVVAWCKVCLNAHRRQDRKDHPEKFEGEYQKLKERNPEKIKKDIVRLGFSKFKVNQEWFDRKLARQDGKCAICGKDKEHEQWKRFSIDHNHDCCPNGKACEKCLRGLLCHRCNVRLGFLEDREWLVKAIAYLNNYPLGEDWQPWEL